MGENEIRASDARRQAPEGCGQLERHAARPRQMAENTELYALLAAYAHMPTCILELFVRRAGFAPPPFSFSFLSPPFYRVLAPPFLSGLCLSPGFRQVFGSGEIWVLKRFKRGR